MYFLKWYFQKHVIHSQIIQFSVVNEADIEICTVSPRCHKLAGFLHRMTAIKFYRYKLFVMVVSFRTKDLPAYHVDFLFQNKSNLVK